MPRLGLGFDMEQFVDHCRMTKPPYECPHASCGRVYRSFMGIQNHMTSFDHENPPPNVGTPKFGNYEQEPLPIPLSTDLKMVEFELDGKLTCISVYDQIEMVSKEFYEASIPPVLEESVQDNMKTPTIKLQGKHLTPKTPKNRPKDKDKGVDVQRYTIEEKKSQKLPEASFKIISNYYSNLPDAPIKTDSYYKFVEKSIEDLDLEVEYDMDEEDIAWLGMINKKRVNEKLNTISMEDFELLMDRLEKESFFQAQSSGRESGAPIDEDAVCCICMDGECQNSNVILFCDMCNLAVHQECYGVPYIPEGQWLCRRCLQSPSRAVDCALCPNKGGAFKQTDDGRWAHVVCAMWIPEVCFANTVFLEPIDSIGNIPPARWKLTCYICVQRAVGACIQCNKVNCYTAFHVTCAQQAGLHMKIDAVRETSANGTSVTVRKAAYCDMHTPADSDARPQVEEMMDAAKKAAAKAASRQKMKKARKILAEKRLAAPVVSVPTLPAERIQQLANLVKIDKRAMFIHRLLAFWTLKRQSRNGVPLLRRLTTSYPRRNANYSNNNNIIHSPMPAKKSPELMKKMKIFNSFNDGKTISPIEKDGREKVIYRDTEKNGYPYDKNNQIEEKFCGNKLFNKCSEKLPLDNTTLQEDSNLSLEEVIDNENLLNGEKQSEEIQYWQRLRQDLERARLLCELIRKREKMKRDLVKAQAEERLVQLAPFVHLLLQKIDQLQEKDVQQIFAEPVDFEEVPDYLDVVKHPMDLSTMRQKAQAHQYQNVEQFTADFELMIDNCLTYNSRDTIFYRAGVRLRDQGGAIIRQLVRDVESIGFDLETGLLLSHRPKSPPNFTEDDILKEIDQILGSDLKKDETYEMRKRHLLYLMDQAHLIKSYMSRIKNIKVLRREIGIIRRKMTCSESGMSNSLSKSNLFQSDFSDKEDSGTDQDDSSVIDDEAEPGVPSRPSSPQSSIVPAATPIILAAPPSTILPEPLLSLDEIEEMPECIQQKRKTSSDEITPIIQAPVKANRKSAQKVDLQQRKIDVFFTKLPEPVKPITEEIKESDPKNELDPKMDHNKQTFKKDSVEMITAPAAPRKRGRPPKHSLAAIGMSGNSEAKHSNEEETSNYRKLNLEAARGCNEEVFVDNNKNASSLPTIGNKKSSVLFARKPSQFFKKATSDEAAAPVKSSETDENRGINLLSLPPSSTLTKESFNVYRQGGEISQETDDDTQSESNSSLTDSEDESLTDSGSDDGGSDTDSSTGADDHSNGGLSGTTGEQIPLEPLDLVWAKCRGYPWYPALIINPKMPRTGYFHNHVPIPVPPDEVLAHASNYNIPMYLVLFFDQKRTWQWLPRNKLEPLGVNSDLDKAKLVESRKPADRKAVKKAYEKAILHRCRVTGENTGLSGDSDNDSQP